jgi:hypothetical protein
MRKEAMDPRTIFNWLIELVVAVALLMAPFATAAEGRTTIYYQDPDGQPLYSLTPKKGPDGGDYRAVPASVIILGSY